MSYWPEHHASDRTNSRPPMSDPLDLRALAEAVRDLPDMVYLIERLRRAEAALTGVDLAVRLIDAQMHARAYFWETR